MMKITDVLQRRWCCESRDRALAVYGQDVACFEKNQNLVSNEIGELDTIGF